MFYLNMKIRPRLNRARPNFYLINDNPNVSLGIVDCSPYPHRIALKNDYHWKRWTCLLIIPGSSTIWKLLQRLSSFLPDKASSFKKLFSTMLQFFRLLLQRIQTLHSLDHTIWYQHFDLRQIRSFRGCQLIVDFDAPDNCRFYVRTMKAMNYQIDIPSIPIDNFKDHYVLVFDLTSMQDATENGRYPELVGEPLRLRLNCTFPPEQGTELIVLGEGMSSVAVDKFGVVEKNI